MKFQKKVALATLFAAMATASLVASAQTIRVANQGDSLSMDPHSLNESLQLSVTGNVYEPLVGRNKDLSLAPALATAWSSMAPARSSATTVDNFAVRRGAASRICAARSRVRGRAKTPCHPRRGLIIPAR